ncbi:MAG: Cysteine desulfurase [Candidatus Roizmanbacteria bacterium GW2011_GWA2_35_8]|uniref:cysteine desulfurase n=1 Tax=Candidatus Roizmanbacteria bacterium GW2011_GWA2_35_8 TaxID=1618479 RepID=A0A0G0DAZ0_9BACT|nr:MAG: Cysteine desulfurase [Candidatus Roizmanbacteria bacterium GW2011_GWA2_35_8]
MINSKKIKVDFPIFKNNQDLVYLDSTATSLKPSQVIEKITEYYTDYSANIFRGVYKISERATAEYEITRNTVAEFINANSSDEIIFTRNATESLNLIAYSWGRQNVERNDEIVTTVMEHHSNFVPWQVLATETNAIFKVIDVADDGHLNIYNENIKLQITNNKSISNNKYSNPKLEGIITKKTKILTITYVSNVLGTINPIKKIIAAAKKINPKLITIIDAAQAIPHVEVDVQELGCDFLVFSSHKMLGPTGVGVLWGKRKLLDEMYPFMYGGEMISEVYLDRTTYKPIPHKFEAGTPAIAEVIALNSAIDYLNHIGLKNISEYEQDLALQCFKTLKSEFGNKIKIFGPGAFQNRTGIISFNFGGYHSHDIASILDEENIAVRAGNHCAMPLHTRLGVDSTVRASFYIYNDEKDIDRLINGLRKAEKILK